MNDNFSPVVVHRITVTVRRAVDGGDRWTTAEVQVEADLRASSPEEWRRQAAYLLATAERTVQEHLEGKGVISACPLPAPSISPPERGDGKNGRKPQRVRDHPVDRFWAAAYAAGLSQEAGLALVRQARGNYDRALELLRERGGDR